jgi:hypothetical protein
METLEVRLIDMQIDGLDKGIVHSTELTNLRFEKTEQLTNLRFEKTEQALVLQAKETERRLDNLNGEAGRLQEMQRTYIQREVYDVQHGMVIKEIKALSKIVYVGLGLAIAVEVIPNLIKH